MSSKISFLSSRPPRSISSLHLSYVLFCDGDPGEYTHTACLNLWCWNFFLLQKSLMHIHKFMSAFIKFSRPLKYCAHAPSVPGLSDQLPASKHQLNVKWGHKLLHRVHYQRLADEDIADHLFPSRPVLWLFLCRVKHLHVLSRHKPPVGRLLFPLFTSSIFIILLPNDLEFFYCCCRKPQLVSTLWTNTEYLLLRN